MVYDKGSLTKEIRACLESLNDGVVAELGAVSIAEGPGFSLNPSQALSRSILSYLESYLHDSTDIIACLVLYLGYINNLYDDVNTTTNPLNACIFQGT
jgi:hypothetical protein